jgi:outer membrane protein insertion porin family
MFPVSPIVPARAAVAVLALAVAATAAPQARAVSPFTLKDIRVEGLQRTDPGTVFAALPFRIGDTYTDEKGAIALRSLFATGLFKDVRIEIDGDVAVVIVDERAVIAAVSFVGLKEFDKDPLTKSLKEAGIGEGLPFDRALIDRAEQEIKRQYLSRSLYGAEVVTTVTPIERNRVNVTFTMTEGEAARIKDIRIVGAKAFSESTLLGLFDLTTGGWLTWYTKSDRYSRAKLNADLETLRAHYVNRGYLEFAVESTQVTISPDKQEISITISIREGQPYTVTAVRLEGDYLGKDDEFKALVRLRPGEPYRGEAVTETAKAFGDLFGAYGYAFARVEPRPEIDRARGQVAVTLSADPQRRVYVRRIDVAGNTRTRDEVVRREFRQLESSWYDGNRIKLSRDRVDRLGYFNDVNVDTTEVAGAPDQVDLTVAVTEKPTGNLLIGASYSNAEKLGLSASIRQDNVFGSGNYLGIEVNTSRTNRTLVLSAVDPYFTVDGISRAVDLFYRTSRPFNSLGDEYQISTPGASVRFGVPVTDFDTVFVGIGVESTRIGTSTGIPNSYFLYRETYGASSLSLPLTLGWARDSRDSALAPTNGRYQRVNFEWGFAGDVRLPAHQPAVPGILATALEDVARLQCRAGPGQGPGRSAFPHLQELLWRRPGQRARVRAGLAGCHRPHRRLHRRSPQAQPQHRALLPGAWLGQRQVAAHLRFRRHRQRVARGREDGRRQLACVGRPGPEWISPVGPLKLSWGTPLKAQPNDRIQRFQFQIGTAF